MHNTTYPKVFECSLDHPQLVKHLSVICEFFPKAVRNLLSLDCRQFFSCSRNNQNKPMQNYN